LKKKLPESVAAKRLLIDEKDEELSVRRQCELLGLNQSTYNYQPATETSENLGLMQLMDKLYTAHPFYGRRQMTLSLRRAGYVVNPKRVRRLMRKMGLVAIYPKPRTTMASQGHRIYPYLLRGVEITRPDQVWSNDITYVPMANGFMYLTAVIDWYSRYVLAWQLSNTRDALYRNFTWRWRQGPFDLYTCLCQLNCGNRNNRLCCGSHSQCPGRLAHEEQCQKYRKIGLASMHGVGGE
jgi:putative transposase